MAELQRVVYVYVGAPEAGIWCDGCLLPARCRFPLLSMSERGVTQISTVEKCPRCDGYGTGDDG